MKKPNKTREPQYHVHIVQRNRHGPTLLGLQASYTWHDDPKALFFSMSRYKFVSKMLAGRQNVAELGCGDGTGARLVQQTVKHLVVTDFDPIYIEDINARANVEWPLEAFVHDITKAPLPRKFDAIYTLDMMEHIHPKKEPAAIKNVIKSLKSTGAFIVGIPSLGSQKYAHPKSLEGHINCKNGEEFKSDLLKWFHNVFVFSMNDEVVHTGFFPMANYFFGICCQPKRQP